MNDIEREIEGKYDEKDYKMNINTRDSFLKRNYKKIILITLGILIFAGGLYLILRPKEEPKKEEENTPVIEEKKEEKKSSLGVVACDDNTSLLNVRNDINGEVIDGLSCFKEVTIISKGDKTENCASWYKVNYTKNNREKEGYVCGDYIKDINDINLLNKVREVTEEVLDYKINTMSYPYCDSTGDNKTVDIDGFKGDYTKSKYKTLNELKEHLLTFMDESLIIPKLELSDYNNKKKYDNYYEIDNSLYCRAYAQSSPKTLYTKNYNIDILSNTENKIEAKIAYEYIKEDAKCTKEELSTCHNSDFTYKVGKLTLEKKDNNYIVTKIDFFK